MICLSESFDVGFGFERRKGGGRVGERWRESGRKVEGEREKGGGRVGEKEMWKRCGRRKEESKSTSN